MRPRNAGLRPDNPAAGVKSPRIRHAAEDFKYLSEEELAKLLAAVPDTDEATGLEKIQRLRDLLTIGMMALQGLRTIEVARASVEDLTEKGEHLVLLVRGKTRGRIAYMRPDAAARLKEYLAIRGNVEPDEHGTIRRRMLPLISDGTHSASSCRTAPGRREFGNFRRASRPGRSRRNCC
ncbi:MAG: hypothetical protein JJE04_27345 [Acidobacteriia bacterium]|nr:hypothetical protein [Terriglobia bacterium]